MYAGPASGADFQAKPAEGLARQAHDCRVPQADHHDFHLVRLVLDARHLQPEPREVGVGQAVDLALRRPSLGLFENIFAPAALVGIDLQPLQHHPFP